MVILPIGADPVDPQKFVCEVLYGSDTTKISLK